MSQPNTPTPVTGLPVVTEALVYAVVAHTGLSFGVVANVLHGARACQAHLDISTALPAPAL